VRILVTGGLGFIGANFIRRTLRERPDRSIVNLDKMTEVANPANLLGVEADPRYRFVRGDVADPAAVSSVLDGVDGIVHFAAESHVDRSIDDPASFYRTNVDGTLVLVQEAVRKGVKRFVHVSTDEVYGSLGSSGTFDEASPLSPNSPYAASKAAADLLLRAWVKTYGAPVVITRSCNNYGPYQFPEKLIPLMILRARADQLLPVYGDGTNVRDWIHVEDHCRALELVLDRGRVGEIYNVGARSEMPNLEIVRTLLRRLGKPESLIRFVEDRPGHDHRYAIDPGKIERELGWRPEKTFGEGLAETVDWYVSHGDWSEEIMSRPSSRAYFAAMYDERLSRGRPVR
jgi:dTDP-glucose 4,6-dehydratase